MIFLVSQQTEIIDLLESINNNLQEKTELRDLYLLITGAILGFLSSFIIYKINERKNNQNYFAKYITDLYSLGEEIRHNAFAIKTESYVLAYCSKEVEIKMNSNVYQNENNGLLQVTFSKVDLRLRDRELLAARLSGKIAEHNIYFGESDKIKDIFNKLNQYDFAIKEFDNVDDIEVLRSMYNPNFSQKMKEDIKHNFEPILFDLINLTTSDFTQGFKHKGKKV